MVTHQKLGEGRDAIIASVYSGQRAHALTWLLRCGYDASTADDIVGNAVAFRFVPGVDKEQNPKSFFWGAIRFARVDHDRNQRRRTYEDIHGITLPVGMGLEELYLEEACVVLEKSMSDLQPALRTVALFDLGEVIANLELPPAQAVAASLLMRPNTVLEYRRRYRFDLLEDPRVAELVGDVLYDPNDDPDPSGGGARRKKKIHENTGTEPDCGDYQASHGVVDALLRALGLLISKGPLEY